MATMWRLLRVCRSGSYAWMRRPTCAHAARDAVLRQRIEAIHAASQGTYGAPRIHADLAAEGERVSPKQVARLMRAGGLVGVRRRRAAGRLHRRKETRPAPDLVERQFSAEEPNRLWVADIACIPSWAGFVCLAVVLDAWNRRIVGWAMATHLRVECVLDALEMAIGQRRPCGEVIHNSDQGSQYTSLAFGARCKAAGVRPSMGSVGDCFDNAFVARASSPRWNVNGSTDGVSTLRRTRSVPSSSSSRADTIRGAGTPHSATSLRSSMTSPVQPRRDPRAANLSMKLGQLQVLCCFRVDG